MQQLARKPPNLPNIHPYHGFHEHQGKNQAFPRHFLKDFKAIKKEKKITFIPTVADQGWMFNDV